MKDHRRFKSLKIHLVVNLENFYILRNFGHFDYFGSSNINLNTL